jgi:hypothetical protein
LAKKGGLGLNLLKFKAFIPLCIIMLIICLLTFGLWSSHKIRKEANVLLDLADQIRQALYAGDYRQAHSACGLLMLQWDIYHDHWIMLINHQEMDRIHESVKRLNQCLYFGAAADAWSELDILVHFIKHIPQKETLNLQNFF